MKRTESDKLSVDTLTPIGSGHMRKTEPKLRQRTFGRLDRARDPAILDAALAVLTENGYDATNMDDIAARAGVGKAAIYRRWASKAALITDTLVYWRTDLLTRDAPDTGSLAGDLDALVERVGRNENDLITNELVLRVAVEAIRDPELASGVDDLMPSGANGRYPRSWRTRRPAVKYPATVTGRWWPTWCWQWACCRSSEDKP
jgi:AcrR family transcriptional regulator